MKYAVIMSGGKQYKVAEGDTLTVDKLNVNPNDSYTFDKVLLVVDEGAKTVGTPTVDGAKVVAKVVGAKRGKKVRVAKFKAKARYRKVIGFKAMLTTLQVEKIETSGNTAKKEKAVEK